MSRYAKWTGRIGFVLLLASTIPPALSGYILDLTKPHPWLLNPAFTIYPLMLALVLAAVLLFTSCALSIRVVIVSKKKCKQVFDAMDQTTVSFRKAQRYKWVLLAAWLICMIGLLAWGARDAGGGLRYYSERPSRLLSVGLAAGVGVIVILFIHVRDWIRQRRRA